MLGSQVTQRTSRNPRRIGKTPPRDPHPTLVNVACTSFPPLSVCLSAQLQNAGDAVSGGAGGRTCYGRHAVASGSLVALSCSFPPVRPARLSMPVCASLATPWLAPSSVRSRAR